LSRFLEVDVSRFPSQSGMTASNAGISPRHRKLYLAANGIAQKLRHHDMDWVVNLGHRLGLKRSLRGKGETYAPLSADERAWLSEQYVQEFDALESQLGVDISAWRRAQN